MSTQNTNLDAHTHGFTPMDKVIRHVQGARQGAVIQLVMASLINSLHYDGSTVKVVHDEYGDMPIGPGALQELTTKYMGRYKKERFEAVSPATHKQILGDSLGMSPEFRLAFLRDLQFRGEHIYAVTREDNGTHFVQNFTNRPGVDNFDIGQTLLDLMGEGLFPADMAAQRLYLGANRDLHIRLVAPNSWLYEIQNDIFYGTITISNSEVKPGMLAVAFGIQRRDCTNLAIGPSILESRKVYGDRAAFMDDFRVGLGGLGDGFDGMRDRFNRLAEIEPKYPYDFARQMLRSMGLRGKAAIAAAEEYMAKHGDSTAYDAAQAALYAATKLTEVGKKRTPPNWFRRAITEQTLWDQIGINYVNMVNEGVDPDQIYMDDDLTLRDRIRYYLKQKATIYDGEASEVLETAADEVLTIEAD